ncbi:malonate decarboxylase holo-ACP synthase [Clostridium magnum]|uniref:Phosphoribosyl-dephospho-CoA transferase n=1 Tax=Clostridium magnum DSM 2767 TaxID=1121326 RepID=A0A161X7X7_9CLOT|nr:malonate decarboxylase holo-ACP synthase [Clostridium magnum]KZL90256.1 phosphoribosyl-dephospho-CoA transferase [Clostridium magnum DSM 2767]SHI13746.1 phosphoribosyl-dephospho-CoA transferase [Clostridium magnum DSM 2767]
MGLKVNDLLKIKDVSDLIGDFTDSTWINEAVKGAPLVVVRCAPLINDMVPVGIRGTNRSQRCAATILCSSIVKIITPEQLAEGKLWRTSKHIRETHIFKTLEAVDSILGSHDITWGPTGSVGFELASGVETVTPTSDLDVVIRVPSILSVKTGKDITKDLLTVPTKVDIQLETPKGSVALAEYARGDSPVLVRTVNGPKLVKNLWSENENLEG